MLSRYPGIEQNVARCRIVLSVTALAAVFIDPTEPMLSRWIPLTGGSFAIDPYALTVMGAHLCYSVAVLYALSADLVPRARLSSLTTWGDVLFGAAIAVFTEGVTSPFYAFFAFAVVESGLMNGFRRAMLVTSVSVGLYLSLIVVSAAGSANFYLMRPVYLAIMGYLVGYLGQQRLNLEAGIREVAAASQRQRIARDLHDGRAQAFAGINLRLESCQELLRRERSSDALYELADLQSSVNREYDTLRVYMRSLAGLEPTEISPAVLTATQFSLRAQLAGSGELVDAVLQIVREGVVNVVQHARARTAEIDVYAAGSQIRITIDDDGVGLQNAAQRPWSISSRVNELGGTIVVLDDGRPGTHLTIGLPVS
jgi:signal transduction histidine kinase